MTRRKLSKEKREEIRKMRNREPPATFREIGEELNISSRTAHKYAKKMGNEGSEKSKCSLDISKDEFFSIFRDDGKTPGGNVLMLPKYKERIEKDENFDYVVRELEKFIKKVE